MRERSRGCISLANSRYCEGFNSGHANRHEGFPDGLVVESISQCRRCEFDLLGGKSSTEGNSNPLQYSCLGNPMDRGAWQVTVHGVAKS